MPESADGAVVVHDSVTIPSGNAPPPSETPPAPNTPPPDGGDDGDDGGQDEDYVGREAKARREARNLRAQLKAERESREDAIKEASASATGELTDRVAELETQLAERDAMIAAVGKFRDPRDVARYIDVSSVPADKLDAEIAKVLKERPYLAATNGGASVPQGQQAEPSAANGADDWLRKTIAGRH